MFGPMTVKHSIIELSDSTPIALPFDDGDEVYYNLSFTIQNVDTSATVYVGGTGVSSSSYGIRLAPDAIANFDEMPRFPGIYAISSVDNSELAVMRFSK
jgi:hypothetical protein